MTDADRECFRHVGTRGGTELNGHVAARLRNAQQIKQIKQIQKNLNEKAIHNVIDRLKDNLSPVKIILFGSYAGGKPRADSDIDLLIVARTELSSIERFALVSRMLADFPIAFDIIFKTPEEYDQGRKVINDIVYFADKYGQVVYEQ